ncbi:MAG: methyltransferase regulatory domain-containing protein [Rhodospirillaceae bacterium]|nr:methyltransferase regulatory domain-containing protein [Rhodospirillales bacterium]
MWTDGVAAIDYTHAFYPEMAPAHLAFVLLLKGIAPPPLQGFRYAELGCGQGLTTNLLACLHSDARFEAVDVLPSHIAGARALAEESGHDNVQFFEETFAAFAGRGGQDLDIIALHGVWSWVSDENRRILLDIIGRRLKPGGAVFLSYNCLPGWAADMPVRHLLLERVAAEHGPLPQRIDRALDFMRRLSQQGGYFDHAPSAAALLESLRGKTDNYIAHEYLNRDWSPFYHADIAAQMAGLDFAASATVLDHLDGWRLSSEAAALVAEAEGAARETLRDTLTYTRFRRDIFVREPRHLSKAERREHLGALRFGLIVPRNDVPESATSSTGDQVLPAALYIPLVDALVEPKSLDQLAAQLPHPFDAIVEALMVLVSLGAAAPSLGEGDAERCRRFNGAVLARNRHSPDIRQLAVTIWGTGLVVDVLDRLFLLAEREGADPTAFAWMVLTERGKRLRRDGRWLETAEDNLAELKRLHGDFVRLRRGRLAALGINPAR